MSNADHRAPRKAPLRVAAVAMALAVAGPALGQAPVGAPDPEPAVALPWAGPARTAATAKSYMVAAANPLAVDGLKSGTFKDGATFVVDRFEYTEGENRTLSQGSRKVVAVMVRNAAQFPETCGWGFAAFKGGDPKAQVVKDGGKACFTCHIPHADNDFLFTRGLN